MMKPLFELGQVVATPGVLVALEENQQAPTFFLQKHVTGDWSEMCLDDQRANSEAIKYGSRIFSAYKLKSGRMLYVITEATMNDGTRQSTCLLLPEEY